MYIKQGIKIKDNPFKINTFGTRLTESSVVTQNQLKPIEFVLVKNRISKN